MFRTSPSREVERHADTPRLPVQLLSDHEPAVTCADLSLGVPGGSGVAMWIKYRIRYSRGPGRGRVGGLQTDEVAAWMRDLRRTDPQATEKVEAAVDVLAEYGPDAGTAWPRRRP